MGCVGVRILVDLCEGGPVGEEYMLEKPRPIHCLIFIKYVTKLSSKINKVLALGADEIGSRVDLDLTDILGVGNEGRKFPPLIHTEGECKGYFGRSNNFALKYLPSGLLVLGIVNIILITHSWHSLSLLQVLHSHKTFHVLLHRMLFV